MVEQVVYNRAPDSWLKMGKPANISRLDLDLFKGFYGYENDSVLFQNHKECYENRLEILSRWWKL